MKKYDKSLFKIGEVMKIMGITRKTLRVYEDMGLLTPAVQDEENGYRYYEAGQIADLHRIIALKNMGFSIEDIRCIVNGAEEKSLLLGKMQEILKILAELTVRLAEVENYLAKDTLHLTAPVLIRKIPEVTVCTMKRRIESYDALFYLMPEMGDEMERLKCICAEPEYCFTQYMEPMYKEEDILVGICEAVTEKKQDAGKVRFKVLPEIPAAACIFHKGSYDTLHRSYGVLLQYIEENGYEISGNIRESYIDGVWNKDSDAEWLTEIQIPVHRIENVR